MVRIWADSKAIKENFLAGNDSIPTVAIERDKKRLPNVHSVEIQGPSRVLYERNGRPNVWIETQAEIVLR